MDAGWINPYVANAYELVARSGPAVPGEWHPEQRNLSADVRKAFGRGRPDRRHLPDGRW